MHVHPLLRSFLEAYSEVTYINNPEKGPDAIWPLLGFALLTLIAPFAMAIQWYFVVYETSRYYLVNSLFWTITTIYVVMFLFDLTTTGMRYEWHNAVFQISWVHIFGLKCFYDFFAITKPHHSFVLLINILILCMLYRFVIYSFWAPYARRFGSNAFLFQLFKQTGKPTAN